MYGMGALDGSLSYPLLKIHCDSKNKFLQL
jgi:hypothetical protein